MKKAKENEELPQQVAEDPNEPHTTATDDLQPQPGHQSPSSGDCLPKSPSIAGSAPSPCLVGSPQSPSVVGSPQSPSEVGSPPAKQQPKKRMSFLRRFSKNDHSIGFGTFYN